jgi:hypothetical protein
MSDIALLVKTSNEKMSKYNERLAKACASAPITAFQAEVVDGQPAVLLRSEMIEAGPEEVEQAKQDGADLKEGDLIPESDPLLVQVARIGAFGEEGAKAEQSVGVLAQRGDGQVAEVEMIKGQSIDFVLDRNDCDAEGKPKTANPRYVTYNRETVYVVVSCYAGAGDETK